MNIGVLSDTHRNREYLDNAVDWLVSRKHVDNLYHLGDDYQDVQGLEDVWIPVVQVPGIYHPAYRDGSMKPTAIETVLGLTIILVHQLNKDISDDDRIRADIILHGHTHKAELSLSDGLLIMNPGHLKGPLDKNMPPSFGLLEIGESSVRAAIFDLDFKEIESLKLVRSENGLYRGY
ncbi:MAG: YfcE family phosphodiesterase [Chitinivibrionales bacterium]|nr:YfcE family phosphodiesterase [Chitinivibrionales bacterium]